MKKGDKVKLVNTKGWSGYSFYRRIKKGAIYTIRKVKPSGGLLLEEVSIGVNMFGEEQGLMKDRFVLVKNNIRLGEVKLGYMGWKEFSSWFNDAVNKDKGK